MSAATDEDLEDRDDDLPTVVVLRKGDLSAEEAQVEIEKQQKDLGATLQAVMRHTIIFLFYTSCFFIFAKKNG